MTSHKIVKILIFFNVKIQLKRVLKLADDTTPKDTSSNNIFVGHFARVRLRPFVTYSYVIYHNKECTQFNKRSLTAFSLSSNAGYTFRCWSNRTLGPHPPWYGCNQSLAKL